MIAFHVYVLSIFDLKRLQQRYQACTESSLPVLEEGQPADCTVMYLHRHIVLQICRQIGEYGLVSRLHNAEGIPVRMILQSLLDLLLQFDWYLSLLAE